MTDSGIDFRGSNDSSHLRDRVAAARAVARQAAEQYVQTRRDAAAALSDARELRAQTAKLREALRDCVTSYVWMLRGTDIPPERAIVLVKSAMVESDPCPDKHNRQVVEEAVRWAVDAYYAA